MVTCFKRLIKAFTVFILVFCILFQSLYFNTEKVYAATPDITQFLNYFLSQSGAVFSNGESITSALSRLSDSYKQDLANQFGDGIYQDSNGDYVFSPAVTKGFYDALNNNSSLDVRTVSAFSKPSFTDISLYVDARYQSLFGTANDGYANCLTVYGRVQPNQVNQTKILAFDVSNVAYITCNIISGNRYFEFYNTSGGVVSVRYKYIRVNGTNSVSQGGSTASAFMFSNSSADNNNNDAKVFDSVVTDYTTQDAIYNNFPFGNKVYCNKSLLLCKNANSGNTYINNNNRVFFSNVYNQFPKVSQRVIENNDWTKIYNNYVNKVQKNKTYITNNKIDTSKLQKIVSDYGKQIIDAIESGNEDIQNILDINNQWLEDIYNLLTEIESELQNGGGGSGGTVSGSTVDLSNIESYLQSLNTSISSMQTQIEYIKNNLPNNEQQLTQIYTVLQNIYQSLQNIPSGGSPVDPDTDPYAPWYPKFFGIPDDDILDTIGQIQIIETLLQGLVPLCYITGIGAVVNALGVQPVTPVFTIPLEFSNDIISVDEDIEIDLSPFDDLRDIVTGGMVILFMLTLGYFTIWLLKFLLDILSKS